MSFKIENGKLKYYSAEPGVTSISIPDSVQIIEGCTIVSHAELISISIPDTVWEIGYHAFYDCVNLMNFHVSKDNPCFTDLDGILYDWKKQSLLCCPGGREHLHIPASVKQIKVWDAFAGCKHLKEITVDQHNQKFRTLNGVLYEYADDIPVKLIRCPVNIQEIQIPESVTEICRHAFEYCSELEEITIPKQVTEIKVYTFKGCSNLKRIHLHSGINRIDNSSFWKCISLKEMILPYGVKEIRGSAFVGCTDLEKIVIPESVKDVSFQSHFPELKSFTCHGIEIPVYKYINLNQCIEMIIHKNLEVKILPELKALILWQIFLKYPETKQVENYIEHHFMEMIKALIHANQLETVQHYVRAFRKCLTVQNLDELIQFAIDKQKYEIQIFLTNLKYQRNDFSQKDWSL